MLADVRTWTTLAYLVLMLPLGIVYFTVAVTGLALSAAFIGAPLSVLAQHFGWHFYTVNFGDYTLGAVRTLGARRRGAAAARGAAADAAHAPGARPDPPARASRQGAPGRARHVRTALLTR